MFRITKKLPNNHYRLENTETGKFRDCTIDMLAGFSQKGIKIDGLSLTNGWYSAKVAKGVKKLTRLLQVLDAEGFVRRCILEYSDGSRSLMTLEKAVVELWEYGYIEKDGLLRKEGVSPNFIRFDNLMLTDTFINSTNYMKALRKEPLYEYDSPENIEEMFNFANEYYKRVCSLYGDRSMANVAYVVFSDTDCLDDLDRIGSHLGGSKIFMTYNYKLSDCVLSMDVDIVDLVTRKVTRANRKISLKDVKLSVSDITKAKLRKGNLGLTSDGVLKVDFIVGSYEFSLNIDILGGAVLSKDYRCSAVVSGKEWFMIGNTVTDGSRSFKLEGYPEVKHVFGNTPVSCSSIEFLRSNNTSYLYACELRRVKKCVEARKSGSDEVKETYVDDFVGKGYLYRLERGALVKLHEDADFSNHARVYADKAGICTSEGVYR